MPQCEGFDPDKVFKRFELVKFPISFVGLSTTQQLDVEVDITGTSYLRTSYEGNVMDFEEAREISPSHRSYTIKLLDCHTIQITFTPSTECIAKVKLKKLDIANRFAFDLRLVNVEGIQCCNNERHAEVGRYYISGQYTYCNIVHIPNILDFGNVALKSKEKRTIRLRNESELISAVFTYVKVTGFDVKPETFSILPNSSVKIEVTFVPNSLKVAKSLDFQIRNPHGLSTESTKSGDEMTDENFLHYKIFTQSNIYIAGKRKEPIIESLHTLFEPQPWNTFLNKEKEINNERKVIANQFLQFSKSMHKKKVSKEKYSSQKPGCYSNSDLPKLENELKTGRLFCKKLIPRISAPDLFNIFFNPHKLDFGYVGFKTFGQQNLTIENKTNYEIYVQFVSSKNIFFTNRKLREYSLKIKSQAKVTLAILYFGLQMGFFEDTFKYIIDKKFPQELVYKVTIQNPVLHLPETCFKFGMATSESFITSVPVKIYNCFNVPIHFEWEELNTDVPFEVLPKTGTVPFHGTKICDLTYISKITRTKSYPIVFTSIFDGSKNTNITIEANIINRKISVKFLLQTVLLKDMPLNLDSTRNVKLENSSREVVVFNVVEPLFPGLNVEPMSGTMRPKSIITIRITLKIPCVMEFIHDLYIKVNNKELIGLQLIGNTVDPKLSMSPKNVLMPRVPCGMISYVPVNIHNLGTAQCLVEILDTGDDNIFDVYIQDGPEKRIVHEIVIKPGQNKTLFVKVYDVFRREYDMYIPFKVNGFLGPPIINGPQTTQFVYYTAEYEKLYENYTRVKLKAISKDINYLRINGVFTVPWIELSVEKFEIDYVLNGNNCIEFTMKNISRYYLHVCIITSKLAPNFSLDVTTEDSESNLHITDTYIKFELDLSKSFEFCLNFHPIGRGTMSITATLYLDKAMSLPFHNLSFTGHRKIPILVASTTRIIFPPTRVGTELSKTVTLTLSEESTLDAFMCSSKQEGNLSVELLDCKFADGEDNKRQTMITVKISICCKQIYARNVCLIFSHECGSSCSVEVCFCYTYCPISLHLDAVVPLENNPYPFYPLNTQAELYDHMEKILYFLERWLFQQGFRRDLFPIIPDTFHALGTMISQTGNIKIKGMNVSLWNFVKRITGPLMKHVRKTVSSLEEPYKTIREIHDIYKSIITLLRARGANLWLLQAKFLLTHLQFTLFCEFEPPVYVADIMFTESLKKSPDLYERLSKQCWLDFVLQCYRVFILDSCFFDCVCVTPGPRDIEMILVTWYNDQIKIAHCKILNDTTPKQINNLTTDLRDGVGIISAIYNHCPFLKDLLTLICKVDEENPFGDIVHNACIIMEAMGLLRLNFPLTSKDFLEPIFLHMLFLSVHLYIVLPMFYQKDIIELKPPLLRTSTRIVTINPVGQEALMFNFMILNNNRNSFSVEKVSADEDDNTKKISIYVKYTANFVTQEKATLLIHGYNKTRIFDTYLTFTLIGSIGALNPHQKCKLSAPIYRPNRVDVTVSSPFPSTAIFKMYLTDKEPTIPMIFEDQPQKGFCFKRLTLLDDEIMLTGNNNNNNNFDAIEHKVHLHLYCLNTQTENVIIWFRSNIGEFFVKAVTHSRYDLAIDTISVKVENWPFDPCSCGESCECYRTAVLKIPHRNDLMLRALRYGLVEFATKIMMDVYDKLIESTTGHVVLALLLSEGGTNMAEVAHILRPETTYRISSRSLIPRQDRVTLLQHTNALLTIPVTVLPKANSVSQKLSIVFTSECGMDIRTYRVIFLEEHSSKDNDTSDTSYRSWVQRKGNLKPRRK